MYASGSPIMFWLDLLARLLLLSSQGRQSVKGGKHQSVLYVDKQQPAMTKKQSLNMMNKQPSIRPSGVGERAGHSVKLMTDLISVGGEGAPRVGLRRSSVVEQFKNKPVGTDEPTKVLNLRRRKSFATPRELRRDSILDLIDEDEHENSDKAESEASGGKGMVVPVTP